MQNSFKQIVDSYQAISHHNGLVVFDGTTMLNSRNIVFMPKEGIVIDGGLNQNGDAYITLTSGSRTETIYLNQTGMLGWSNDMAGVIQAMTDVTAMLEI